MPTPEKFKATFFYEAAYHIVFKSVDGLFLFKQPANYALFLDRFKAFTDTILDIWAYSLLQNHVHLIVKVKSAIAIQKTFTAIEPIQQTVAMKALLANSMDEIYLDAVIERQINSFMVSYTSTINNKENRKGGFFQKPFKRILIADDTYLQQAVIYVHANAEKHQLVDSFLKYRYSSFDEILAGNSLYVNTQAVIKFFGNVKNFNELHVLQVEYYYKKGWPSSKLE